MSSRNIRLLLSYDGTDFYGWQVQARGRTVQGVLEEALGKMHRHDVPVLAAGRTDSGVHADGQVANFFTDIDSIPAGQFARALNSYLPRDVKALASSEADPSFHSRYGAVARIYQYRIQPGPAPHPLYRRYALHVKERPDIVQLNRMAACLVGTHDFTAFTVPRDANPTRVRTVHSACFFAEGPFLVFRIAANAFLWRMVRSLVGTMLELEQKMIDPSRMEEILRSGERERAGTTAPAHGLVLHKVIYHGEPFLY